MSDRDLDPREKKFGAWMKRIEDRLTTVERRPLTGAISLDSLDAGPTAVSATRTDPLVLKGSKTWTSAVEYLGEVGPVSFGVSGQDALVTRSESGKIQDIQPHPFTQLAGGPAQSIASTVIVPITLIGAAVFSAPYAASATIAANGVLVIPVNGIYDVLATGAWPNVVGTKGRVVIVQLSTDGGATWATLFADGRPGINTATLGQNIAVPGRAALLAGWRLRIAVIQDEVGALTYTPDRFSCSFCAGYSV